MHVLEREHGIRVVGREDIVDLLERIALRVQPLREIEHPRASRAGVEVGHADRGVEQS